MIRRIMQVEIEPYPEEGWFCNVTIRDPRTGAILQFLVREPTQDWVPND